jgi:hypothetical protein
MRRFYPLRIKRKPTPLASKPGTPSPWIGVSTGIVGTICGLTSLTLSINTYVNDRPRFIIDIQSDFTPAPVSSGKNGIPYSDYSPDRATGTITIPCDIINTGEKSEVIRHVKAETFFGRQYIGAYERREPISVGAKQATHMDFTFDYCSAKVTSNVATLKVTLMTSLGAAEYQKEFRVFAICPDR